MPRAGQLKPESEHRLSDRMAVGVLTKVFPPWLVDEVVEATGSKEQRVRALPARSVVYFAIGMALYSQESYENVMGYMTEGLSWASGESSEYALPSKSAISQARDRLGSAPVEMLFRRAACPLAKPDTPGSWLAGRRLMAIDGTTLDLDDSDENAAYFGRPGVSRGEQAAFPQVRLVGLGECGAHSLVDVEIGAYRTAEVELAIDLVDRFKPDMLVLADRGFYSYGLWARAAATGADLLWRVKSTLKPRFVKALEDGSWIGEIRARGRESIQVRVIEYEIKDGGADETTYRLITTIMDPNEASAGELAEAYAQRWEIESVFDELKTHLRGPRVILRSRKPKLVIQEIYGYLCCHYAIRTLMVDTAAEGNHDPDRISFTAATHQARRSIAHTGDFPPSRL